MPMPPKKIREMIERCEQAMEDTLTSGKDWLHATSFALQAFLVHQGHQREATDLSREIHRESLSYYHPQLKPA